MFISLTLRKTDRQERLPKFVRQALTSWQIKQKLIDKRALIKDNKKILQKYTYVRKRGKYLELGSMV